MSRKLVNCIQDDMYN